MLEFEQDDHWPSVVPDRPKDLNQRRVAFTKGRAPAIVLSAVSEMDAGDPFVVALEKPKAIFVGRREMTNIERGLEVEGKCKALYETSFGIERIRVRK